MPRWLARLICHLRGHAWAEGWTTVRDARGAFQERRLVMRCVRCGETIAFVPQRFDTADR